MFSESWTTICDLLDANVCFACPRSKQSRAYGQNYTDPRFSFQTKTLSITTQKENYRIASYKQTSCKTRVNTRSKQRNKIAVLYT